ncbi:hypothetical protein QFZ72_005958 [Bacillus sp. V2I10]|nr:hypothetical protein [Bacillus sp. V2I10]
MVPIVVSKSLEQRCSIIHKIVELLSDKLTELLYYLDKLYFSCKFYKTFSIKQKKGVFILRKSAKFKKSFKELMQENRQELLNDKQALEKIEKRIEKRHELKKLA